MFQIHYYGNCILKVFTILNNSKTTRLNFDMSTFLEKRSAKQYVVEKGGR